MAPPIGLQSLEEASPASIARKSLPKNAPGLKESDVRTIAGERFCRVKEYGRLCGTRCPGGDVDSHGESAWVQEDHEAKGRDLARNEILMLNAFYGHLMSHEDHEGKVVEEEAKAVLEDETAHEGKEEPGKKRKRAIDEEDVDPPVPYSPELEQIRIAKEIRQKYGEIQRLKKAQEDKPSRL